MQYRSSSAIAVFIRGKLRLLLDAGEGTLAQLVGGRLSRGLSTSSKEIAMGWAEQGDGRLSRGLAGPGWAEQGDGDGLGRAGRWADTWAFHF